MTAAPARGEGPTAADKETARGLMDEGNARRDRHDLQGALESFKGADGIMHVPTTSLEVARTEIALGMLVEGRDKLLEILRMPAKAREPKAFTEARNAAQSLSDDLEARIPALHLVLRGVPDGASPSVSIDGENVPSASLNAWRRLNPGHHEIVAHAATLERREEASLHEREKKEVVVDLSPAPAAAPTPAPEPVAAPATTEPAGKSEAASSSADTAAAEPKSNPWKTVMFVGFGVGGVGIIVGSITGILSISDTNSAKSIPADQGGCAGNVCGPAAHDDIQAAKTTGTISTIAFIAGGAGIAAGVVGLVLSKGSSSSRASTGALHAEPWLGPGSAGVHGTF